MRMRARCIRNGRSIHDVSFQTNRAPSIRRTALQRQVQLHAQCSAQPPTTHNHGSCSVWWAPHHSPRRPVVSLPDRFAPGKATHSQACSSFPCAQCARRRARRTRAYASQQQQSDTGASQSRSGNPYHRPGYTHLGGSLYMDRDGMLVTMSPEFENYKPHARVHTPPRSDTSDRQTSDGSTSSQSHDRRRGHRTDGAKNHARPSSPTSSWPFFSDQTTRSGAKAGSSRQADALMARLSMRERKDVRQHLPKLDLPALPCSKKELKAAYNAAAKRFHPDVKHSREADPKRFHEATQAYQGLLKVLIKLRLV